MEKILVLKTAEDGKIWLVNFSTCTVLEVAAGTVAEEEILTVGPAETSAIPLRPQAASHNMFASH